MTPYIITTKITHGAVTGRPVVPKVTSRRAVATLDEARHHVASEVNLRTPVVEVDPLAEQGGTLGPLPDGTEIQVEATTYAELADAAGIGPAWSDARVPHERVIAVYNAARGSEAVVA